MKCTNENARTKIISSLLVMGLLFSSIGFPLLTSEAVNAERQDIPQIRMLCDHYHYTTADAWGKWFEDNYPGELTASYLTGPLTYEELINYDIFITYLSWKSDLGPLPTASEVEALEQYVRDGGGVMLMGDDLYGGGWTNVYCNILSEPYNVYFNDDQLLDPTNYDITVTRPEDDYERHIVFHNIAEHPTTVGVNSVWVHGTCSLVVANPDAVVVVAGDDDTYSDRYPGYPQGSYPPAIVALEHGSGRILFAGDYSGFKHDVYDNSTFIWNILKWLANPSFFVDLSIVEVKPIQVLEDVDFNNDGYIDLVAGKATAVKVIVESTGAVENVRVVLNFNQKDFGEFAIYKSWNVDDKFKFKSYSQKKLDFEDASQRIIYFFPDNPHKSPGNHLISAEVIPPSTVEDINDSNNFMSNEVMVYDTLWDEGSGFPNLRVYYISSDWNSPDDPAYTKYYRESSYYLQSVLPVSPQRFEVWANTKWSGDSTDFRNLGSNNDDLLDNIEFMLWAMYLEKKLKLAAPTVDRFINVMPAKWFKNFTSQLKDYSGARFSSAPNLVFAQVNNLSRETSRVKTSTHEIGHSYGLRPNCEEYDPCNPARVDGIGNAVHYGLWIEERMLMNYQSNHHVYCFMGSLEALVDYWIDSECYENLFDKKDTVKTREFYRASGAQSNKGILVSGTIYPDDSAELDYWYLLENIQTDFLNPGEYNFVFLDDSSNTIFEKSFRLDFTFEGRPLTQVPFAFSIPYIDGTKKILIRHKDTVLVERIVSNNAPVVNIASPNGEESVRGTVRIQWNATDADGDNLSYAILFSSDGGQTWNTLAIDLKQNYYNWNTSRLEEGDQYLVKVIATDSFNTGIDVSDAVFSVRNPIQSGDSHYVDVNKMMKSLSSTRLDQAESLKEEAYSLLQEAIGKGIDISEAQALIEEADEILADAKESFSSGNYIAANTLALEAIDLYQQAIKILKELLSS